MKMTLKKALAVTLTLIILTTSLTVAFASENIESNTEGECVSGCKHQFNLDGDIKTPVICLNSGEVFYESDSRWYEVDSYKGNNIVSTVATLNNHLNETDELIAYYVAECVDGNYYDISFDWAINQGYIDYGLFSLTMYHNGNEILVRDFTEEVNAYENILSEEYRFTADGELQVFKFVFEKIKRGDWIDDGRTAYLNNIVVTEHDFDSTKSEENLTRPTVTKDGYYTYYCKNCDATQTEPVKLADYSGVTAAVDSFLALVKENNGKFTENAVNYISAELEKIYNNQSEHREVINNLTEDEQYILDSLENDHIKLCDSVKKGIADGTMIIPDYTEIEGKITEFKNTHTSEEYNALITEIIADYNSMTAKNHPTAADAADEIAAIETKMDKTENCSHMCHQDGIWGFFWKIVNFLLKIFGSDFDCSCGITHNNHAPEPPEFIPVQNDTNLNENRNSYLSNWINTTLEDPEFVAADNEATNVLANGD